MQQLVDTVASLTAAFSDSKASQDAPHEAYLNSFQDLHSRVPPAGNPQPLPPPDLPLKPPKLHLQPFDGTSPLQWLFQANQFFTHYAISPNQRLAQVYAYMTGDALGWYQWMHSNHLLTTWDELIRALELRFGPSSYDNHKQALFKLHQTGSVADYQLQFERLCNRVMDLRTDSILDYFLSGLHKDIQQEMAVLQPTNISQAIGLAKLLESKFADKRGPSYPPSRNYPPKPPPPLLPSPPPRLALPVPLPPPPTLPICRLTPTEM